jgi:hypothetical protein
MTAAVSTDDLRRLAETRPAHGRVLSLFLDLDPSEFATADARSTAITSLLDEAEREVAAQEDLSHEEEQALRADLEYAGERLRSDLPADGARGLALFVSTPADLDELIPVSGAIESGAVVGEAPVVEPLLDAGAQPGWCVLLLNRRLARFLEGSADGLREIGRLEDDVHGQHSAGGWSQARFERSVEEDVKDHRERVVRVLGRRMRRRGWDGLLIGCPEEMRGEVEELLGQELAAVFAGFVDVDVADSGEDEVLAAAAGAMEEEDRRREREALDRLHAGVSGGGGAEGVHGLPDVLAALHERRVETLLLAPGFSAPGTVCPACGMLHEQGVERCPADETATEPREDLTPLAVEAALTQAAHVRRVRHHDDLEPMGGIAATLRF